MDILMSMARIQDVGTAVDGTLISSVLLAVIGIIIADLAARIARYHHITTHFWINTISWAGFLLFAVSACAFCVNVNYKSKAITDNINYVKAMHIKHEYPHLRAHSRKSKTYHKLLFASKGRIKHIHRPQMWQYL